ncbi:MULTISPECIES: RusA family crossover junction endodeoxyribonuclease [unclassified Endozoicomonas]|uniref:RusA family crossover junction endodeoxyribonuclease n=1 Tax=unclassified Endozoicomonas TaxID=2644528 RepID=UPI003BB7F599
MDGVDEWLEVLPVNVQMEVESARKRDAASVFIGMAPVSKGRPRFTRQGRCHTPKATQNAENQVQRAGQLCHRGEPLTGALAVLLLAVFPIPASWSKKKKQEAEAGMVRPAVKPDFDNVVKLYCDALNGIVWEDDKQIVDGRCIKVYGQRPGVLVLSWGL